MSTLHRCARTGAILVMTAALAACGGQRLGPAASAEPGGSIAAPISTNGATLPPPPSFDHALPPTEASPPAPSDPLAGTPAPPLEVFANHADPDLEARLPARVDQAVLSRFSLSGPDFLGTDPDPAIEGLLAAHGRTATDFTFAGARDPTGTLGGWVDAYRLAGVDHAALRDGVVQVARLRAGEKLTVTDATLGGRPVTQVTFGIDAPAELAGLPPLYLFPDGDALFLVYGQEATAAALVRGIQ